jgi:hypothetical protein
MVVPTTGTPFTRLPKVIAVEVAVLAGRTEPAMLAMTD